MRIVKVPLGPRGYEIRIGTSLLARLGAECVKLKLGQRCAVISDQNVAPRYAGTVIASLKAAGFDPVLITACWPAMRCDSSLGIATGSPVLNSISI